MKRTTKIELSIIIGLVLSFLFNIGVFSSECEGIRNKVLRMHVIANSDSAEDQELKLKVRDAVLSKGKELFDGSITSDEAEEKILPYIDDLEKAALSVVIKEGYDYNVNVTVQEDYFKTRIYENSITLPAGYYTAVKVIIGEGKGKNWWCVMFPPMCLPVADSECEIKDVLSSQENDIVKNGTRYKFKFKLVEIYEDLIKKYK